MKLLNFRNDFYTVTIDMDEGLSLVIPWIFSDVELGDEDDDPAYVGTYLEVWHHEVS